MVFETDAAPLRAAFLAAQGNKDAADVQAAFDGLLAQAGSTRDTPDFETAAQICPVPVEGRFDGLMGLIVETRCHRNLPFVVRQVIRRCDMPVQIIHGPDNRDFIQDRLGDVIESGQVVLSALGSDRLSGATYNGLFLSPRFWEALAGRGKILVFQTDAMLCRRSTYGIWDFMGFDYIGSRRPPRDGVGFLTGGGNGGLSLRDWTLTLKALNSFDPHRWPGGEDGYFSLFIDAVGGRVSTPEESDRFCGQRWFQRGCFGLHKPNFRKPRLALAILHYEPRAWRLLAPIEKRLAQG